MDQICLKKYSGSKMEKVNIITEFHTFKLILVSNFNSNWQFWFFGPNLPKKVFPVENRKSKHHHGILHIWISLGKKNLSFWTKFIQKRYFKSKTEQAVQGLQVFAFYVVNVNSTAVFKHFEELKDLIILNILKENWLYLASWALKTV